MKKIFTLLMVASVLGAIVSGCAKATEEMPADKGVPAAGESK